MNKSHSLVAIVREDVNRKSETHITLSLNNELAKEVGAMTIEVSVPYLRPTIGKFEGQVQLETMLQEYGFREVSTNGIAENKHPGTIFYLRYKRITKTGAKLLKSASIAATAA